MGAGEDAVVDARLRARGVEGLRVADASIMPTVPGGNTNAASISRRLIGPSGSYTRRAAGHSAKNGEPREVRLHHGIVAGALRIPTPCGFDEDGANLYGIGSLRGQCSGAAGVESSRGRSHEPPQA
jgi:hypothetical protein